MGAQRTLYVNSTSAPGAIGRKSSLVRLTWMICARGGLRVSGSAHAGRCARLHGLSAAQPGPSLSHQAQASRTPVATCKAHASIAWRS